MSMSVPSGRGRWRLTLHERAYAAPVFPTTSGVAELIDARARQLVTQWCQPAQLAFTLDGRSDSAAAILELQHDVIAWRWDETSGADVPMFRGPVLTSQDSITEDAHEVVFTCQDYLALLMRRVLTNPLPVDYTNVEQDTVAANLLALAVHPHSGTGTDPFYPGSFLPLTTMPVNPDGTARGASGQLRTREYLGSAVVGTMFDELAKVINGFDYDVLPRSDIYGVDRLRLFYPSQGVTRTTPALHYGSTVASVTRNVTSADYANYVRVLGNNQSASQATAQIYAEQWNSDANNVGAYPIGMWMNEIAASDVIITNTLSEQAQGQLNLYGILMPSYTLGLTPDTYSYGSFNMGDTLPLIIQSGRLNVVETQRVMGITYDIGDDGQEDVTLVVARPNVTLFALLAAAHKDIRALARR